MDRYKKAPDCSGACSEHLTLWMVWVIGLEPTTSQSRTARATNCATPRTSFFILAQNQSLQNSMA